MAARQPCVSLCDLRPSDLTASAQAGLLRSQFYFPSTALCLQLEKDNREGGEDVLPPKVPLWYKDGSELRHVKNSKQREALLCTPLSASRQSLHKGLSCCTSPPAEMHPTGEETGSWPHSRHRPPSPPRSSLKTVYSPRRGLPSRPCLYPGGKRALKAPRFLGDSLVPSDALGHIVLKLIMLY